MFSVSKNGTTYYITEKAKCWAVDAGRNKLSMRYEIDKKLCNNADDVKRYIVESENF